MDIRYRLFFRKKKLSQDAGDDFYLSVVGPKMLTIGTDLDDRIKQLKKYICLNESNIGDMLDTHKFLTDFFFDMTGQRKRSLASKYLHFHVPNMFFIYDSRAVKASGQYTEIDKNMREKLKGGKVDVEYMELAIRLFSLQKLIQTRFDVLLTPRQIDSLLLKF